MNLCSNKHDEICFEGRNCPLCEKIEEYKEWIERLEDKISELGG